MAPNTVKEWIEIGKEKYKQRNFDDAIEAYNNALTIDPRNVESWIFIGNCKLSQAHTNEKSYPYNGEKEFKEAIEAYQKALELNPDDLQIWSVFKDLIKDESFASHTKEIIDICYKLLEKDQNNSQRWYYFGNILKETKNIREALIAFKKSLNIEPHFVDAWISLGECNYKLSDIGGDEDFLKDAMNAFTNALEFDPNNGKIWACIGDNLNRRGSEAEALYCWEQAILLGFIEARKLFSNLSTSNKRAVKPSFAIRSANRIAYKNWERTHLERLQKLIKISDSLKIRQIAIVLEKRVKSLYPRLIDWALEFGFTLTKDVLNLSKGRKQDFIGKLEGDLDKLR